MFNRNKNKKQIKRLVIIVLILLGLVYFRKSIFGVVSKINSGFEKINFELVKIKSNVYLNSYSFNEKVSTIKHMDEYISYNKEMYEDLEKSKLIISEMENLVKENSNLRNMLEMKEKEKNEYIAADVILIESNINENYIYINKGIDDGVEIDFPIIYNGEMIGRVSRVTKDYSEVMLITNKNSKISVILNDSELKIMRGNGDKTFSLHNYNSEISENNNLIFNIKTSGISEKYPKGLNIGRFKVVDKKMFLKTKNLVFETNFKIFNIKNVLVLKTNLDKKIFEKVQGDINE